MLTRAVSDPDFTLYVGDVRDVLTELPAESVQCVVTSPPYWGLRDYGTGTWAGGDPECDHRANDRFSSKTGLRDVTRATVLVEQEAKGTPYRDVCGRCGAQRQDSQLGLESTPGEYVAQMVAVFAQVRRVLRKDGVCWLNIGDTYSQGGGPPGSSKQASNAGSLDTSRRAADFGAKPKDLVGIPWMLAFALRADGWYLRSEVIWAKPNPMPESVVDRPTKAHEQVFLLTRSPRYFYDVDAIREPLAVALHAPGNRPRSTVFGQDFDGDGRSDAVWGSTLGRNARSVWEIATEAYPDAHFATFPTELARRCIVAGTSERGCCPVCGTCWTRVVERQASNHKAFDHPARTGGAISGGVGRNFPDVELRSVGWSPGCACVCTVVETGEVDQPYDPVPCTVLDPFMGSGTVAHVARTLGRRSVGVDLNPSYAQLASDRTAQLSLFA